MKRLDCKRHREKARASGQMYYEGTRCRKCNGTKRYVSYGGCVNCCLITSAERRVADGYHYVSANGPPVFERDMTMRPKAPWPVHRLEDAEVRD